MFFTIMAAESASIIERHFAQLERYIHAPQDPQDRLSSDLQKFYQKKIEHNQNPLPFEIQEVKDFFTLALTIAEEINVLATDFVFLMQFLEKHAPGFLNQFDARGQKFASWHTYREAAQKEAAQ